MPTPAGPLQTARTSAGEQLHRAGEFRRSCAGQRTSSGEEPWSSGRTAGASPGVETTGMPTSCGSDREGPPPTGLKLRAAGEQQLGQLRGMPLPRCRSPRAGQRRTSGRGTRGPRGRTAGASPGRRARGGQMLRWPGHRSDGQIAGVPSASRVCRSVSPSSVTISATVSPGCRMLHTGAGRRGPAAPRVGGWCPASRNRWSRSSSERCMPWAMAAVICSDGWGLLHPCVVVGRHVAERGDLLAAQPLRPPAACTGGGGLQLRTIAFPVAPQKAGQCGPVVIPAKGRIRAAFGAPKTRQGIGRVPEARIDSPMVRATKALYWSGDFPSWWTNRTKVSIQVTTQNASTRSSNGTSRRSQP